MDDSVLSLVNTVVDLSADASDPLYQQLYQDLQEAITRGHLPSGTKLPSTRTLADRVDVSRNTVVNAFEQLRSEGYVESRVGAGTFVSEELPEEMTQVISAAAEEVSPLQLADTKDRTPHLSMEARRIQNTSLSALDDPISQTAFRQGIPALDAFPIETWSKLASRRWRFLPPEELVYGDPAGYPPLRAAIAKYLRTSRGVLCEEDQIIIVSGAQQAITLVAQVLLDSGDPVCVEDPGFPQMRAAFTAAGARLDYAPVDEEGIKVSELTPNSSARIVGVTPSHQYPLGVTMTMERRLELLEWAAQHEAWILEDDYDSQFRYGGEPLAALQGLDNSGRVLYTGTFSKILFPALRLGFLVLPPDLVDPIVQMRSTIDRCPPRINQMVLTDFITEGHLKTHIRQMRTLYAARQDALLEAVNETLGGFIDIEPSRAGLHLVGWLPKGVDDRAVSNHLRDHDIIALPLSFYSERALDRGALLLGYGCVPEDEIYEAVRRMTSALAPFLPPNR